VKREKNLGGLHVEAEELWGGIKLDLRGRDFEDGRC
jgi:hypothetical protein